MKECDPDAFWKSTLDSLVHAKLLVSDTPQGVVQGDVTQTRAKKLKTTIILEELD